MKLLVPFAENMQTACDEAEAGFHFEEGGCWGMALALHKEIGGKLVLRDGDFTHVYVSKGFKRFFDWQGRAPYYTGRRLTPEELMAEALACGVSEEKVLADQAWAEQIIARAKEITDAESSTRRTHSHLLDGAGRPIEVFHGTSMEFDVFDLERAGCNFGVPGGIFFSDERWVAEQMADYDAESSEQEGSGVARVITAHLSLANPLVRDFTGGDIGNVTALIEEAKRAGHDGVIALNAQDGMPACPANQFIAFDAGQISIVDNRPCREPQDDDALAADSHPRI